MDIANSIDMESAMAMDVNMAAMAMDANMAAMAIVINGLTATGKNMAIIKGRLTIFKGHA